MRRAIATSGLLLGLIACSDARATGFEQDHLDDLVARPADLPGTQATETGEIPPAQFAKQVRELIDVADGIADRPPTGSERAEALTATWGYVTGISALLVSPDYNPRTGRGTSVGSKVLLFNGEQGAASALKQLRETEQSVVKISRKPPKALEARFGPDAFFQDLSTPGDAALRSVWRVGNVVFDVAGGGKDVDANALLNLARTLLARAETLYEEITT